MHSRLIVILTPFGAREVFHWVCASVLISISRLWDTEMEVNEINFEQLLTLLMELVLKRYLNFIHHI